jgi:N-acyl-L-homoserine lactone synthetase
MSGGLTRAAVDADVAPELDDAAALRLDAAADHMVRRLAAVRFRLTHTESERDAAFRLRFRAVVERGWRPAGDMKDGLEREELDDHADHLVGWLGDLAIANCRIIYPRPDTPQPMEREFGVDLLPTGNVVQLDRVCVDRERSDRRSDLLIALLCAAWREIRGHGYRHVGGIDSAAMLRLYRRVGLEHTVIGAPREYWGEPRYPVQFSSSSVTPLFYERVYATERVEHQ